MWYGFIFFSWLLLSCKFQHDVANKPALYGNPHWSFLTGYRYSRTHTRTRYQSSKTCYRISRTCNWNSKTRLRSSITLLLKFENTLSTLANMSPFLWFLFDNVSGQRSYSTPIKTNKARRRQKKAPASNHRIKVKIIWNKSTFDNSPPRLLKLSFGHFEFDQV